MNISVYGVIVVLIETLWNVKYYEIVMAAYTSAVLIETLWNVKLVPTILKILCPCINRNIMECKGRSILQNMRLQARINRNIMECKED